MGRLVDADNLKAKIEAHEIIKEFSITEYECGHNEGLCIGIDEVDEAETVEAIPVEWIGDYLAWLKGIGTFALSDANAIKSMLKKWEMEQGHSGCGPDYCNI